MPGMPNSRIFNRITGYSINEANDVQFIITRYNAQIAILIARRNQIINREQRFCRDDRMFLRSDETDFSVENDDKNNE
jgi:hypothetical protein